MLLAPIILFVYNRPYHTEATLKALMNNFLAKESDLIIFSDGPKNEGAVEKVEKVRTLIKEVEGFKSISIIERTENIGLSNSIISGVSDAIEKFGRCIVLEDDLITSPYFLKYLNSGLNKFETDDRVVSIHSYIYPVKEQLPDYFFLRGADCWGWATWKRGWEAFDKNGEKLFQQLIERHLTREFDFNNTYQFTKMLKEQIEGQNDSWAIRWHASAFLKNLYTLYPGRSFVSNIGNDSSGTHKGNSTQFNSLLSTTYTEVPDMDVKEDANVVRKIEDYFREIGPRFKDKLSQRIKKFLGYND
jgi:hypothetical protein